jgi:hypothetical protein
MSLLKVDYPEQLPCAKSLIPLTIINNRVIRVIVIWYLYMEIRVEKGRREIYTAYRVCESLFLTTLIPLLPCGGRHA